jgi:hypothetical protein
MLALNKMPLLGTLPEEPKLVCNENGTPQCSFTMLLAEKCKSTCIGCTRPSTSSATSLKKSLGQ